MPFSYPSTSNIAHAVSTAIVAHYLVSNRASNGKYVNRGPYEVRRVPVNGNLQMPGGQAGQLIVVDERVFFPIEAMITGRSIVTNVVSNQSFEVVYVQRWGEYCEAWVRRAMPE